MHDDVRDRRRDADDRRGVRHVRTRDDHRLGAGVGGDRTEVAAAQHRRQRHGHHAGTHRAEEPGRERRLVTHDHHDAIALHRCRARRGRAGRARSRRATPRRSATHLGTGTPRGRHRRRRRAGRRATRAALYRSPIASTLTDRPTSSLSPGLCHRIRRSAPVAVAQTRGWGTSHADVFEVGGLLVDAGRRRRDPAGHLAGLAHRRHQRLDVGLVVVGRQERRRVSTPRR